MRQSIQTFLTRVDGQDLSHRTKKEHQKTLQQFDDWCDKHGHDDITDLTAYHLENFLAHLSREGYAGSSIKQKYNSLLKLYGSLKKKGVIDEKPTDDVDLSTCVAGFSGNRSPHLHLPQYVTSEDALQRVKEAVEDWCTAEGITLDTSIYDPKSLFRMWGGEHRTTDTPKLPISVDSTAEELTKSLVSVLNDPPSTIERREEYDWGRVPGIASEPSKFEGRPNTPLKMDIPVIERRERPTAESELELWKRYNRHPFNPYTNAHLQRSVAVVRVKGTPFCRIGDDSQRTKVPVYVYAAVGGDGDFRITKENTPLELSPPDYQKWDYEPGDTLVVMGAGNGRSKFFDVDAVVRSMVVGVVFHDIHRPDNNRLSLHLLSEFGYDVGKRGTIESNYGTESGDGRPSDAAKLQADAERGHPSDLTHMERRKVANSLLQRRGWGGAWKWFKTQYGDEFDPALTHDQFTSIIDEDDFDHVREFDIPPEPGPRT